MKNDVDDGYCGGVWRACEAHELEKLTSNGWSLREVLAGDQVVPGLVRTDHVVIPGANGCGGYASPVQNQEPSRVVRRPLFLLARSRDEELAILRETVAALHEAIAAAGHARDEADRALKKAEAARDHEAAATKRALQDLASVAASCGAERDRANKMEADLAKVRKEVGEARVREIVGAK